MTLISQSTNTEGSSCIWEINKFIAAAVNLHAWKWQEEDIHFKGKKNSPFQLNIRLGIQQEYVAHIKNHPALASYPSPTVNGDASSVNRVGCQAISCDLSKNHDPKQASKILINRWTRTIYHPNSKSISLSLMSRSLDWMLDKIIWPSILSTEV